MRGTEADQLIVAKRPGNAGGAKGLAFSAETHGSTGNGRNL